MALWLQFSLCDATWQYLAFLLLWAESVIGAASTPIPDNLVKACRPAWRPSTLPVRSFIESVTSAVDQEYSRIIHGQLGVWDMVQLVAACSLIQAYRLWRTRSMKAHEEHQSEVGKKDNVVEGSRLASGYGKSIKSSKQQFLRDLVNHNSGVLSLA